MKENNTNKDLNSLLQKYYYGAANVEEFKKLIRQLNASDDEETVSYTHLTLPTICSV